MIMSNLNGYLEYDGEIHKFNLSSNFKNLWIV